MMSTIIYQEFRIKIKYLNTHKHLIGTKTYFRNQNNVSNGSGVGVNPAFFILLSL